MEIQHEFSDKICKGFLVLEDNYPFLFASPVHIKNTVFLTTVLGWYTTHSRQIHPIGTCSLLQGHLLEYETWHTSFETKSTPEIVMLMERMDKGMQMIFKNHLFLYLWYNEEIPENA